MSLNRTGLPTVCETKTTLERGRQSELQIAVSCYHRQKNGNINFQ